MCLLVPGAGHERVLYVCRYLEQVLNEIRDPYEIAIVAYALSVVNSGYKEAAFFTLDNIKRQESK